MWEDISYCWVVTCKNHIYHIPRNFSGLREGLKRQLLHPQVRP